MTVHSVPREGGAFPLDWLVTPALAFSHPNEVLSNPDLTDPERKAILASWASDARAVENMPWIRRVENGSIVSVSEVLKALRALDCNGDANPAGSTPRRGGRLVSILRRRSAMSISAEGAP